MVAPEGLPTVVALAALWWPSARGRDHGHQRRSCRQERVAVTLAVAAAIVPAAHAAGSNGTTPPQCLTPVVGYWWTSAACKVAACRGQEAVRLRAAGRRHAHHRSLQGHDERAVVIVGDEGRLCPASGRTLGHPSRPPILPHEAARADRFLPPRSEALGRRTSLRGIRDDRPLSACHDDRTMTSGHGLLDRAPWTQARLLLVRGGLGGEHALGRGSGGGVDEVSLR